MISETVVVDHLFEALHFAHTYPIRTHFKFNEVKVSSINDFVQSNYV